MNLERRIRFLIVKMSEICAFFVEKERFEHQVNIETLIFLKHTMNKSTQNLYCLKVDK